MGPGAAAPFPTLVTYTDAKPLPIPVDPAAVGTDTGPDAKVVNPDDSFMSPSFEMVSQRDWRPR